jgi:uncharacterized protein (TIRG00374 family)
VAAIVALILASNPGKLGVAISRFRVAYVAPVIALSMGFYLVQGVRWHYLLRGIGIRVAMRDTLLMNQTGQASALLPLGEMTRALLLARAADVHLGAVVATITVQELIYAGVLLIAAIPGALQFHVLAVPVIVAFLAMVGIFVILIVEPVFDAVLNLVVRIPLLRRARAGIEELREDTLVLLQRGDTYYWSWLDFTRATMGICLFWLVVQGIAPGSISWTQAAFVYAIAQLVSAISFSPGGLGALEAGTAGLLVAVGLPLSIATAGAILQRLADKGLQTVLGLVLFLYARKRYHFEGEGLLSLTRSSSPAVS